MKEGRNKRRKEKKARHGTAQHGTARHGKARKNEKRKTKRNKTKRRRTWTGRDLEVASFTGVRDTHSLITFSNAKKGRKKGRNDYMKDMCRQEGRTIYGGREEGRKEGLYEIRPI
jgi:hypothetical protein